MTTQLDCSIGLSVAESTYGTPVTVSKFVEHLDETLDADLTYVESDAYRVGTRFHRGSRRTLVKQMAGGDINVEVASKGLGALLKAALGTVTTTQRGSTGVYQQVHSPATTDYLESYTIQKGVPLLGGGAAVPYTFPGSVCDSFELACPNSATATLKTTWVSRETRSDISYAAPSYPAGLELFSFVGGSLVLGGTIVQPTTTALATGGTVAANIRDWNLTYKNNLDDAGYNLGSAGRRSRPPALGRGEITGTMTAEFDSTVLAAAYLANTPLAMVLNLQGFAVIGSGSDVPALQVVVSDIRLNGELPKTGGGGVITQSIGFTGEYDTTNAPIKAVYVSTDTAP
jgi:hypothetical protein